MSAILQGTAKRDVWIGGMSLFPSAGAYYPVFYNQTDYWELMGRRDGQYTENDREYCSQEPRCVSVSSLQQYAEPWFQPASTKYLQNGAYMRLKNITPPIPSQGTDQQSQPQCTEGICQRRKFGHHQFTA